MTEQFRGEMFIIGAGSMAEAYVKGMLERRVVAPGYIRVINRSRTDRVDRLRKEYGVFAAESFSELEEAHLVVVAVKPFDVQEALGQARPYLRDQTILSFAAGVPTTFLRECVGDGPTVVRAMPNIPVAVLAGATAVAFEDHATDERRKMVNYLLRQVGSVVEIPEQLMDAATAFSGSGPGFVCYFLEAMENAAVKLGFDETLARKLLLQTVVGTARTLEEWGLSPAELRRRVTSPNGTTHAGVQAMDKGDLPLVVEQALQAAAFRSREMGEEYTSTKR